MDKKNVSSNVEIFGFLHKATALIDLIVTTYITYSLVKSVNGTHSNVTTGGKIFA